LAEAGRGARDYVAPNEDIEAKVSSLYQKVSHPALTDVKLEWNGVEVDQVFPKPVPDLFHGGELALYGRFRAGGGGKGTLVVTGKANGKPARFEFPVELPAESSRNAFLPRRWASQKIGHELDMIRLSGRPADPEVVSSIVRLAKKHGIVTPYTSFLVTEEGTDLRRAENEGRRRFDALSMNAARSGFSGGSGAAAEAQADSMTFREMSAPSSVAAVRGIGGKGGSSGGASGMMLDKLEKKARDENRDKGFASVATRTIGGKTFYDRRGTWVDADAEAPEASSIRTVTVAARSAAYFDLLAKDPGLARYFALGSEVTVLHRGIIYKVSAK
jgi:Ca-activated chloride channel family protein